MPYQNQKMDQEMKPAMNVKRTSTQIKMGPAVTNVIQVPQPLKYLATEYFVKEHFVKEL